jgi:hypothetical protein
MSFLEDLFEGRRHGQLDGHGRYRDDHHDDHHDDRRYPIPEPHRHDGTIPSAPPTVCEQCQAPVPLQPGFRFCPYCGGSLAATAACAGCGAARVTGSAFCGQCGAKL